MYKLNFTYTAKHFHRTYANSNPMEVKIYEEYFNYLENMNPMQTTSLIKTSWRKINRWFSQNMVPTIGSSSLVKTWSVLNKGIKIKSFLYHNNNSMRLFIDTVGNPTPCFRKEGLHPFLNTSIADIPFQNKKIDKAKITFTHNPIPPLMGGDFNYAAILNDLLSPSPTPYIPNHYIRDFIRIDYPLPPGRIEDLKRSLTEMYKEYKELSSSPSVGDFSRYLTENLFKHLARVFTFHIPLDGSRKEVQLVGFALDLFKKSSAKPKKEFFEKFRLIKKSHTPKQEPKVELLRYKKSERPFRV